MTAAEVIALIKESEVKFIDFRFTDTIGKEQHVTVPAHTVDDDLFEDGKMFDGSSISGWKGINESDMILMPDPDTAVVDVFPDEPTMNLRCTVVEPSTMQGYDRCPRSLATRAEAYLKSTGVADAAYFGPENEFFVFDHVSWDDRHAQCVLQDRLGRGRLEHRPQLRVWQHGPPPDRQGWLLPGSAGRLTARPAFRHVPGNRRNGRNDRGAPSRGRDGRPVRNRHEVQHAGPQKADEVQIFKYVVHNVAHAYGKTATFMPKPLVNDNGSGMHVHQSLFKNGENLFSGDGYGGLSETALFYIGGIIKHAKALNAFTNPATNSYKRLVPGFEAPTILAYSARNRSASIRIPYVANPKGRRVEVRFPDSMANPYLAFAAMMMAGLDGVLNKIHPGDAMDKDLYDLPPEEEKQLKLVAFSLDEALASLDQDREFLKAGDVFSDDLIDAYIDLKMDNVTRLRMTTNPVEFDMYYSL